jgi:hypothetical protein
MSRISNDSRQWTVLTMEEIFDFTSNDSSIFNKPSFPTKRWSKTYTKTSTDDIRTINLAILKYKEKGFLVRKRIDYETMKKFHKSFGNFYLLQIKK